VLDRDAQQKAAAAEASYAAEQLQCVDDARSLEESKACRERVREKWRGDAGAGKDRQ